MLNKESKSKIIDAIPKYFEEIKHPNYDEQYKWEALKHFQRTFDINASNFPEMLKNALSKTENLLSSRNYYPNTVLIEIAEGIPIETKDAFIQLLDESVDVSRRINAFKDFGNKKIKELFSDESYSSYQDDRSISVYLSLKYPGKYFLFKSRMVSSFCRLMGIKLTRDKEPLIRYWELAEELKTVLLQDHQIQAHISNLPADIERDANINLLVQDFVWITSQTQKEEKDNKVTDKKAEYKSTT